MTESEEKIINLLTDIRSELKTMNKNWEDKELRMVKGSRQAWSTPNTPIVPLTNNEPIIPNKFNFSDHMPNESKL